jgi:hypothetical protein
MLFTELALIRWVGANNVFVNNATNFVLLASFLGIGIGFLNARAERDFVRWTPLALLALPPPLSLAIVFVPVMAGLGQAVARTWSMLLCGIIGGYARASGRTSRAWGWLAESSSCRSTVV